MTVVQIEVTVEFNMKINACDQNIMKETVPYTNTQPQKQQLDLVFEIIFAHTYILQLQSHNDTNQ